MARGKRRKTRKAKGWRAVRALQVGVRRTTRKAEGERLARSARPTSWCAPYNINTRTLQILPKSRRKRRESGVWQRRFWEHTLRDEEDFQRHLDYIHHNPVKHGYARCPHSWTSSSFHQWVAKGGYDLNWCCRCDAKRPKIPNFTDIERTVGEVL